MWEWLSNQLKSAETKRQERISAYVDGELSATELQQFKAELARDSALRAEVDALRRLRTDLSRLPRHAVPRNYTLDPAAFTSVKPVARPVVKAYPALRAATVLTIALFLFVATVNFWPGSPGVAALAPTAEMAADSAAVAEVVATEAVATEAVAIEAVAIEAVAEPAAAEMAVAEAQRAVESEVVEEAAPAAAESAAIAVAEEAEAPAAMAAQSAADAAQSAAGESAEETAEEAAALSAEALPLEATPPAEMARALPDEATAAGGDSAEAPADTGNLSPAEPTAEPPQPIERVAPAGASAARLALVILGSTGLALGAATLLVRRRLQ